MSILRHRLDYPANGFGGFMISNAKYFRGGSSPIPENFTNPPIKMTVSQCECKNFVDCFYANQEDWIDGMKEEILSGELGREFPFWNLVAVEFNRYNPVLRFGCEAGDIQNLYLSRKACVDLNFEIVRSDDPKLYKYEMCHSGKPDSYGYFTTLVESIDGEITRFFEFGIEMSCEGWRTSNTHGKEYLIVTEYY